MRDTCRVDLKGALTRLRCSRGALLLALLIGSCQSLWAEGIAATSSLFLRADPGNYVGYTLPTEGQTFIQGDGGPTFRTILWAPEVTEFYSSGPQYFNLTFSAPRYSLSDNQVKARPIEVGFYDNARRVMTAPDLSPGMEVSGFARGYNQLSGWFNVIEVTHDSAGEITSLAVDFAEFGENLTKSGPGLYGSFRYNSAIPLTVSIPEPGSNVLFLLGLAGVCVLASVAKKETRQTSLRDTDDFNL